VAKSQAKTFKGTLERLAGNGLNWVIVRVPFSVEETWGARGNVKVHVRVADFDYRTSLFPTRKGDHFLLVNKKMQKAAKIGVGSVASFSLTPDTEPREIEPPKELISALNQDRALRRWFDRLSYSIKKWLCDLVAEAKSQETRRQRAGRVAEQAMEAMEAEQELPPMIRTAFQGHPGMEQAWRSMTEIQRRNNLLAIFYYRTPQSRLKRIEKLIHTKTARDYPE
jgi:uncharacterized protein YdeI (YjbR/CyaY-like superfamily)